MTAPIAKGERVLVTGGAGYLGGVVVPHLVARGVVVRVLDALIFGSAALEGVSCELVKGDVRDPVVVANAMRDVSAVVHLAGFANDPSGELDPAWTIAVNRDAVAIALRAAREAGARRFVFASSPSVYGACEVESATEDVAPAPLTWYARTKAEAEILVREANSERFVTASVRPGTVCGRSPRQRLDLVVNMLTSHAAARGNIMVFGGKQVRPHLHLKDVARLFETMLVAPGEKIGGEVFNASSESCTVLNVAERARAVVGPHVTLSVTHTKDERSYHLSAEKIRKTLGFEAIHTIEEAMREIRDDVLSGRLSRPDDPAFHNVAWLKRGGFR